VLGRGKLVVVNNQVDQTTGTVQLKAELPNPDLRLWPGQFVTVRLLIDTLLMLSPCRRPQCSRVPLALSFTYYRMIAQSQYAPSR
jgi:hypothetical protein